MRRLHESLKGKPPNNREQRRKKEGRAENKTGWNY